ncbi:Mpp10 protein [Macrolepiota fuliginosa MF-IS2]|uniref:U3 small nucleolar ribonucleoprotein protein MPP10 n=1 Tax=Macrolepiota fuliginosa MF-IS2 TaxID=1400762 RepID=A0A9P5XLU9_9AGAR|nr:Mpp10 protein [Macrolepiota fuliginosa MF-IS2]
MSIAETLSIPHELDVVTNRLDERIESLAHGNDEVQNAALHAAKYIFDLSLGTEGESKSSIDELLSSLNPLQKPQTRSQAKSDDGQVPRVSLTKTFETTPLSSLFIENMDPEQVWMQLDLRAQSICNLLEFALETGKSGEEELSGEEEAGEGADEDDNLRKVLEAIENGEEVDLEALRDEFWEEMDEDESEAESDESEDMDDANGEHEVEDVVHLHSSDEEHPDSDAQNTLFDLIKTSARSKKKKSAAHGLNDDFFDLDAFNAETERAEAKSSSRGRLTEDSDSEDETMSMDLFAPVDDEAEENEAMGDILYRDFFALPKNPGPHLRTKAKGQPGGEGRVRFHDEVRVKKIKAKGKSLPLSFLHGSGLDYDQEEEDGDYDNPEDEDESSDDSRLGSDGESTGEYELTDEVMDEDESYALQSLVSEDDDNRATIERLKDDLFAEDDGANDDDGALTLIRNRRPLNGFLDMTTHERRQVALREQIAQLESENVAKKDWTLMGEAGGRSRPQNSLLEEDLDFERVMKPVPVISEEVVEGLEQRIKARILENQFDDVVRVRPLEDKPFLPSRIIELQDTKSTQSLAQIYENDYLASQGGVTDDRSGKLKREHEEIEQQWEKICSKLDALCNAHFVPKQPKAVISTVSNVATASMESALPTAKATSSILAPEEVFNPASSETRLRSELTPAEKRALRTKERKAKKKRRDILDKSVNKVARAVQGISGVKKEKQAALQNIVKAGKGVTVVGKQATNLLSSKKRQKS